VTGLPDFYELLAALHEPDHSSQDTLEAIVALACEALHSDHAGVMLVHDGGSVESVAVTDALVTRGDDLQRTLDEGPCLSAIEDPAHIQLVPRTVDDSRWPHWGPAADRIGIRSVVSVRLSRRTGDPIGSLNVYNQTRDEFDDEDADIARVIGRHASTALAALGKLKEMDRAITARTILGQAEGILMAQYGLHEYDAFDMMRRYSKNHNLPLDDIAQQVVNDLGIADSSS